MLKFVIFALGPAFGAEYFFDDVCRFGFISFPSVSCAKNGGLILQGNWGIFCSFGLWKKLSVLVFTLCRDLVFSRKC